MTLELVTVETLDGVSLDGALYRPSGSPADWHSPVLVVHGLTWNFYRGPARWLPPFLIEAGYPCLALNMRDHDLDQPKDFHLSHHDLRSGIDCLERIFGTTPVLLGHGYACNKLVSYLAQSKDSRVSRYVLTTLGSIKKYRPDIWEEVLANARALQGRAFIVQGEIDELIEPQPRADELIAAAPGCRIDVSLLSGANHYFDGRHDELARDVIAWLGRTGS